MKNLKTEFNFNFTELDEVNEYLKKGNLNDDAVSEISDIKCVLCNSGTSMSFNTPEELDDTRRFMRIKQIAAKYSI